MDDSGKLIKERYSNLAKECPGTWWEPKEIHDLPQPFRPGKVPEETQDGNLYWFDQPLTATELRSKRGDKNMSGWRHKRTGFLYRTAFAGSWRFTYLLAKLQSDI